MKTMDSAVSGRNIVSEEEWLAARKALLAKEKAHTHAAENLARERLKMPWVKVEKDYVFETPQGKKGLADLFEGRSQLIVYHFMFAPGWSEGCPNCSYLADHFDGPLPHLAARDVTFTAISRAPLSDIAAFKKRMGWTFNWASSGENDFNFDYHVSFTDAELQNGQAVYNFEKGSVSQMSDWPGASAFYKDAGGTVYHTYSTYARGLDQFLGAYRWLDIAPKGRDEDGLAFSMAWVRHHDKYGAGYHVDPKAGYHIPAPKSGGECGCH